MGKLVIINAPRSFLSIWSTFVRPLLNERTAKKVDIYSEDYLPALLALVPPENLPASLGGECKCTGSGGCHLSSAGPWMDGRRERREAWLKGERKLPCVDWVPDDGGAGPNAKQTSLDVGTVHLDEEELQALELRRSSSVD
jgi:hypothetical protein